MFQKVEITRNADANGKHTLSLLKHIYVERGTKEDWDSLSALHYKGHNLAAGRRIMRCVYDDGEEKLLVGVMVFAYPMPLNKGRNRVFPWLKANQEGRDSTLVNKMRMKQINRLLTWNNRIVLDTMFRSAGIAYRFVNLGYRMYCSEFGASHVESNSSMARFNPFWAKVGTKFVKPESAAALEEGIDFFKHNFVAHPCDQKAILAELEAMPEGIRKVVEAKMRDFYYRKSAMEKSGDKMHIGMTRIDRLPIDKILREIVQLVFGSTIYWIWTNPDKNNPRKLPERIPLLAFDNQPGDKPFDFEKLVALNEQLAKATK